MSLTLSVILTILGLSLSIFIPLLSHILKSRKENRQYYSLIWKGSSKLTPKDILGERPFNPYYYERSEDSLLRRQMESRNNVLVTGTPLSGKTRAVFQQFINLKKKTDVLIPRNVSMSTFVFPSPYKFWRKKTVFIDDLQYFIEKQDHYHLLFKKAKENKINIVTTCHTGQQFKKVKNILTEQNLDIETIFGENIIEFIKVTPETGKEIAGKMNIDWDKVKFNGTVGSIFMRLSEMERRFDSCSNIEKTILNTIRMMYITGLWDNKVFSLDWLKLAAKRNELEGKDFEWAGWLKSLEDKEFIKIARRNKIWADDAYLEYIVKPLVNVSDIEIFDEIIEVFESDSSALNIIGEKAYNTGLVDIDIEHYMKLSIKAFSILLKQPDKEDKLLNAKANEYMGLSHWKLSTIEEVKENCLKALFYYSDALKEITPEEYPVYYARLQSAIGNAYVSLADIHDREHNCKKAIECFNNSLKYISDVEQPMQFGSIHHNLGNVYNLLLDADLADAAERPKNLKLAIESNKKALKIRTMEHYPREYALTSNNMGVSYLYLSENENKIDNLKLAIEHFNNVQQVCDKKKDPIIYSLSITNLGYVYSMLAECENMDENIQKAIDLLNESIEIRTPDKFPIQYATSLYSLGAVYLFAGRKKNSPEFCYKSIDSFEECLTIRTFDKYPLQYALTQNLLAEVYTVLSELEDKSDNYQKALKAYDEALRIYTEEDYPRNYSEIQESISNAKKKFLSK